MGKTYSFKFLDNDLNQELIGLLKKADIDHSIDKNGTIRHPACDEKIVGNDHICSIYDKALSPWQILHCPRGWAGRYRDYMRRHGVPFREGLSNGGHWFLIPRRLRPLAWKLEPPAAKGNHAAHKTA